MEGLGQKDGQLVSVRLMFISMVLVVVAGTP